PGDQHSTKYNVCVSDVRDIEDNMWCPHWGIKGKMDITAEVKIHKQTTYPKNTTTRIVPLELKTGRPTNSVEHRGQLILYTLMLTDVMSSNIDMGLLLYLKNGDMLSVPANHMDKRELLYLRNQLAYYLSQKTEKDESSKLPDLIDDDFTCSRCQHLQKCALLY
ncbi:DNA replication ATP-dependent helicase/nuclease DNA2-like, partial [Saccoglossus kowalevskii]